ncbi:MAG: crotonase [Myxococcales bacterium]|nr:crotonase [Myxococcales bacterium]
MKMADLVTRQRFDGILVGTINRPDALNALNRSTLAELTDLVDDFDHSSEDQVLVITGAGKSFVAGADIHEMVDMGVLEAKAFSEEGQELCAHLSSMNKLVVAGVNGFALGGGCELAMACDLIYASEKARFGQPEVKLGVIPGFGGTQRLSRIVGPRKAMELVVTGAMIDAEEANRIGLVNRVLPAEDFLANLIEALRPVLEMGPLAVAGAKLAIHRGLDLPLERALSLETEMFAGLFATDDQEEGMRAFLDKRRAKFSGM